MVPCAAILQKAKEENVDMIGLSGLITPSLDEMVHVAKEMERLDFDLPLLIGGATTSKAHTAVKIEQNYHAPVAYVPNASRAVGVCQKLLNRESRDIYAKELAKEFVLGLKGFPHRVIHASGHIRMTNNVVGLAEQLTFSKVGNPHKVPVCVSQVAA